MLREHDASLRLQSDGGQQQGDHHAIPSMAQEGRGPDMALALAV